MKRHPIVLVALLIAFLLTPALAATAVSRSADPASPAYVPGRVLVKFRRIPSFSPSKTGVPQTGITSLDQAIPRQQVKAARALFPRLAVSQGQGAAVAAAMTTGGLDRIYRLDLESTADISQTIAALASDPNVEYAEPDYIAQSAGMATDLPSGYPNDPQYPNQWGLSQIQITGAWNVVTGTASVAIAVIDSGIDLAHPDLVPNLWVNPGEIPANGVDDDADGFVDDIGGWNFVAQSNNVADDNGHGTLVAGIAAARTDNGVGIAGVCGGCRIMPVKVMQSSGVANYSDIAAGVAYATAKGARVIDLSLGGYANSQTLHDAINAALAVNIVVVGGVGNDGTSAPFYPAAYSGVIGVAGTTTSDTKVTQSNYGSWVSLSAPGENILSTALGGDYAFNGGTSLAAPFVSGMAGLLVSLHPDWTRAMVRSQLMHTADPIDVLNPGYAGQLGAGRLDATRVILPPHPMLTFAGYSVNGAPAARPDFGVAIPFVLSIYNDWADANAVSGTLSTTDSYVNIVGNPVAFGNILSGQTVAGQAPLTVMIGAAAGYNHAIPFQLQLSANNGAYSLTVPFTVTTRSSVQSVSGTIAQNTVWTNDKTYVVSGNSLGVAPGVTLTIQPGTVVRFASNLSLNVGGTLIADGTAQQPIVFMPDTPGSAWNRVYFDDPSTDAVVDAIGNYSSGNVLRNVQVQGAAGGIVCNSATPYLSQLSTDAGGINCTLGAGDFWLLESSITGNVSVSGTGHVRRSAVTSGNLSLGAGSDMLMDSISGTNSISTSVTLDSPEKREASDSRFPAKWLQWGVGPNRP